MASRGKDTQLDHLEERRRNKDAAAGSSSIASSSFLDLKAQLEDHRRSQPSNSSTARSGKSGRIKSLDVEGGRSSKSKRAGDFGSDSRHDRRNAKRSRHHQIEGDATESRHRSMARKTTWYDDLSRGRSGGFAPEDLTGNGKLAGLVDWEAKMKQRAERDDDAESADDDHDDGSAGHRRRRHDDRQMGDSDNEAQEEMAEYEDDLGRTRRVPRSKVPMQYLVQLQEKQRQAAASAADDDQIALYGPQTHFPTLVSQESMERRRQELAESSEQDQHFDASQEVRNRGAGFFKFSDDPTIRAAQMERLAKERNKTEQARGNQREKSLDLATGSDGVDVNAAERRLEERRRFVEVKRREIAAARRAAARVEGAADGSSDGAPEEDEAAETTRRRQAVGQFLDGIAASFHSAG